MTPPPPTQAKDTAPKLRPGIDVRKLPLSMQQGYLLSQVDGATTPELLADVVGAKLDDVLAALIRLEELGAIDWIGTARVAAEPPPAETELSREEQAEISAGEQLHRASHWIVLGLHGSPAPADIKRAYFNVSKRYHPDRFFGRKLGSFAPRVDALFRRACDSRRHPRG